MSSDKGWDLPSAHSKRRQLAPAPYQSIHLFKSHVIHLSFQIAVLFFSRVRLWTRCLVGDEKLTL
jgi:hypothetical protein